VDVDFDQQYHISCAYLNGFALFEGKGMWVLVGKVDNCFRIFYSFLTVYDFLKGYLILLIMEDAAPQYREISAELSAQRNSRIAHGWSCFCLVLSPMLCSSVSIVSSG
jgi:hypothetical protein